MTSAMADLPSSVACPVGRGARTSMASAFCASACARSISPSLIRASAAQPSVRIKLFWSLSSCTPGRPIASQLGNTGATQGPDLLLQVADLLRPDQQAMGGLRGFLGLAQVMVHPEPHDLRVRPIHVVADPLADGLAFVHARSYVLPVSDAHRVQSLEHVRVVERRGIFDFPRDVDRAP